jgi:hypothetical protein
MLNNSTWVDQRGNLWMYSGGYGLTSVTATNDLWMYCMTTNEWDWVSGDSTYNSPGNWGTLGVSSPSNVPDGRMGAVGWTSAAGDLYLFGGHGPGALSPYNDMWRFVIDTNCVLCPDLQTSISKVEEVVNEIYPNPATDFLNIHVNSKTEINFRIYDLNGKEYSLQNISSEENKYSIDVSNFAGGLYLIRWENNYGRGEKIFVVGK